MIRDRDDLTFEQWQAEWYRLIRDVFGAGEANKWLKRNLNHHTILKQLWVEKGFRTYGEYRKWEADHIEERNAYFRQRGDEFYVRSDGDRGRLPADGDPDGGEESD